MSSGSGRGEWNVGAISHTHTKSNPRGSAQTAAVIRVSISSTAGLLFGERPHLQRGGQRGRCPRQSPLHAIWWLASAAIGPAALILKPLAQYEEKDRNTVFVSAVPCHIPSSTLWSRDVLWLWCLTLLLIYNLTFFFFHQFPVWPQSC